MSRLRHSSPNARRAELLALTRTAEPLGRSPANRRERRHAARALQRAPKANKEPR